MVVSDGGLNDGSAGGDGDATGDDLNSKPCPDGWTWNELKQTCEPVGEDPTYGDPNDGDSGGGSGDDDSNSGDWWSEPDWDGDGEPGGNLSDRDTDGDGIPDWRDPQPNVPNEQGNQGSDGFGDYYDDSDNDGIPDSIDPDPDEDTPTSPNEAAVDILQDWIRNQLLNSVPGVESTGAAMVALVVLAYLGYRVAQEVDA